MKRPLCQEAAGKPGLSEGRIFPALGRRGVPPDKRRRVAAGLLGACRALQAQGGGLAAGRPRGWGWGEVPRRGGGGGGGTFGTGAVLCRVRAEGGERGEGWQPRLVGRRSAQPRPERPCRPAGRALTLRGACAWAPGPSESPRSSNKHGRARSPAPG